MRKDEMSLDEVPEEGDGIPVAGLTKLALVGALIAVMVIFVLQNLNSVRVDFLSWNFDMPLILLLAIAAVAGVVIRWLIGFIRSRRKG
jgi:uncharacterized integral membrane protein